MPRRIGRAATAALPLLVLLTFASGCCCLGGMPAPGEVTLGGVVEEGLQKIRDAGYRAEMRELERQGGPEASRRLLDLANEPRASYRIHIEAIRTLGRLRRPEDVPALLRRSDWWQDGIPYGLPWTTDALADIGGPEACGALTELLRDRLPKLAHRAYNPDVDITHLAAAVARAGCLEPTALTSLLWTYGADPWIVQDVQKGALQFLAEHGDAEAAQRLAEYASLERVAGADYSALEAVVMRADLPWWLRADRMIIYTSTAPLPRERLFDTYFRMLVTVYEAKPPRTENQRRLFDAWADQIGWNRKAWWAGGEPEEYFIQKRKEYQESLAPALYEHVARWIDYAEKAAVYREALRPREGGGPLGQHPRRPNTPDW